MAAFHQCVRLLLRAEKQKPVIATQRGKGEPAKEGTNHREAESVAGKRRGRQAGHRKRTYEGMEQHRLCTLQGERQNI